MGKSYKLGLDNYKDGDNNCLLCGQAPKAGESVLYLDMKLKGLKGFLAGQQHEPIHLNCADRFRHEIDLYLKDAEKLLAEIMRDVEKKTSS